MNTLFNTQDNQEFLGIRSDASLNKANKKGTPQYEEWLRKYREKRGAKPKSEDAAKEKSAAKDVLKEQNKHKSSSKIRAEKISNEFNSFPSLLKDIKTEEGWNVDWDGIQMGCSAKIKIPAKIKRKDDPSYISEYVDLTIGPQIERALEPARKKFKGININTDYEYCIISYEPSEKVAEELDKIYPD